MRMHKSLRVKATREGTGTRGACWRRHTFAAGGQRRTRLQLHGARAAEAQDVARRGRLLGANLDGEVVKHVRALKRAQYPVQPCLSPRCPENLLMS
jgi:hypothetical protein